MAHLALYSFSVGMTHEQQQALVRGEQELPEAPPLSKAEAPAKAPPAGPRLRRRARTEQGTYQPDDPTTPVDEAFEEVPEAQPEAEAQPGKLVQRD